MVIMSLLISLGLINATVMFWDTMNRVFRQYFGIFVIVIIDDIFIHREVKMRTFVIWGLCCKFWKTNNFFQCLLNVFLTKVRRISWSYINSCKCIEVESKKMYVVNSWPIPFTPLDSRTFFDLVGYYRIFVEEFSFISSRLTTLTLNKSKFMVQSVS